MDDDDYTRIKTFDIDHVKGIDEREQKLAGVNP